MEFELPVGRPSKAEFLDRVGAILEARGFERKAQRFIRKPEGFVRAQILFFHGAGGRLGNFRLAPFLDLKGKAVRGAAASREHVFGALLADFGMRLGVERANHISYYDNWFGDSDWFELFERVIDRVLSSLEPTMKDEVSMREFLARLYPPGPVVFQSATKAKKS
jgi:hypothetical protein